MSADRARPSGSRLAILWWKTVRVLAVAYPLALLAVIAAFRLIGERWWVTEVGLYLPRVGFALPLPFLVLALLFGRSFRWLATQVVALALLLFPLGGLHLALPRAPTPGAQRLRVLTFNIDSGRRGIDAILARVRAADPDVILLQETPREESPAIRNGLSGYYFDKNGQFVIASRFPIEEAFVPSMLFHEGKMRTDRFMRYRIATPVGPVHVYSLHPISPREGLDDLRGQGVGREIASGHIFTPDTSGVKSSTALRVAQLEAVAADAATRTTPVIIAGDTNSPGLSWAFGRSLGSYRDAFADAGRGFGYTFPANRRMPAWMRIDRILTGQEVRVVSATVLRDRLSDHFALTADLELPAR
jgi:vancomycin resistance protein VanJ